jgi:foldase protein PrsA
MLRHLPACATVVLASVILAACGGGGSDGVVARVGDAEITNATLDHWTTVLLGGHAAPASAIARRQALRWRALAFLISAEWLVAEAAARRALPSELAVHRLVDEREQRSFPGGKGELREFLHVSGQTVADMELEARVGLISSRLRQLATAKSPTVTPVLVADYYNSHPHTFVIPEAREARISNRKSAAAADEMIRRVRAGASFYALSVTETSERPNGVTAASSPEPLIRAIYSARPHVLTGPIKEGPDYNVIEVERVRPATRETLRQASGAIAQQLREASLRRALVAAVGAWRTRWRAKTSCRPGYVVQKCRQYSGPQSPEDPLAFN